MSKSPSQLVKDKFGDKTKLVDALKQFVNEDLWVGRENKDKGLARVSNAKLLRLIDTFTTVKAKWGTRGKLIDAVVEAAGRTKDAGFRAGIEGWPVPRLYDLYKSAAKRAGQLAKPPGEKKRKPAPVKKAAAPKKTSAKSLKTKAAKKTAAKKRK